MSDQPEHGKKPNPAIAVTMIVLMILVGSVCVFNTEDAFQERVKEYGFAVSMLGETLVTPLINKSDRIVVMLREANTEELDLKFSFRPVTEKSKKRYKKFNSYIAERMTVAAELVGLWTFRLFVGMAWLLISSIYLLPILILGFTQKRIKSINFIMPNVATFVVSTKTLFALALLVPVYAVFPKAIPYSVMLGLSLAIYLTLPVTISNLKPSQ